MRAPRVTLCDFLAQVFLIREARELDLTVCGLEFAFPTERTYNSGTYRDVCAARGVGRAVRGREIIFTYRLELRFDSFCLQIVSFLWN